jgi:peptidoglycan-associated lipoprotein
VDNILRYFFKLGFGTRRGSMRKIIYLILFSITLCFVVSCGTTRDTEEIEGEIATEMDTGMMAEESVVQTSGIGDESNLVGSDVGPSRGSLNTRSFYFAFDSYTLNPKDMSVVKKHAQYLLNHPNAHVVIEGNTDVRGSREYNIGLGHRRANAVADVLKLSGVKSSQVRTLSYGEERPIALGHTEEAYRLNRRSDIVYEK